MPVHSAIVMRLSNADAIPAQPGFVHSFAECGERIDQIITTLSDRFAGPLRIRSAIVEGGVEARRAGDGIKHCAVAAHFCDQLQSLHTGHHFITTVRRIAAAGVHHILHIQRVTLSIDQLVRLEKLQRFTALLAFVDHGFIADIRGCFFVDQADGTQLFLPPLAAHLPQFAIPPVSTQHSRQRTRNKVIGHWLAAAFLAAQLFKGRRDHIKAHCLSGNLFP